MCSSVGLAYQTRATPTPIEIITIAASMTPTLIPTVRPVDTGLVGIGVVALPKREREHKHTHVLYYHRYYISTCIGLTLATPPECCMLNPLPPIVAIGYIPVRQ